MEVLTKLIRFITSCTYPIFLTYQALQDNNETEIQKRVLQWATLSLLMLVEPVLSPLLNCIPGGSAIIPLIYLWIFSAYFSLADIMFNKVLSNVTDPGKVKTFFDKFVFYLKHRFNENLQDLTNK